MSARVLSGVIPYAMVMGGGSAVVVCCAESWGDGFFRVNKVRVERDGSFLVAARSEDRPFRESCLLHDVSGEVCEEEWCWSVSFGHLDFTHGTLRFLVLGFIYLPMQLRKPQPLYKLVLEETPKLHFLKTTNTETHRQKVRIFGTLFLRLSLLLSCWFRSVVGVVGSWYDVVLFSVVSICGSYKWYLR